MTWLSQNKPFDGDRIKQFPNNITDKTISKVVSYKTESIGSRQLLVVKLSLFSM